MMPGIYQQLLQSLQGGGAQGFMQPASGAPQLPQMGQRGASMGMPNIPSAFNGQGQMNGNGGQGQQGGGGAGGGGGLMSMLQSPQTQAMFKGLGQQFNKPASAPSDMMGPMPSNMQGPMGPFQPSGMAGQAMGGMQMPSWLTSLFAGGMF